MLSCFINVACRSTKLKVIFVADIFGVTVEFEQLCQQITLELEQNLALEQRAVVEFQMIGPYQKQPKSFACEHDAYQYFSKNVGLASYVEKLAQQVSAISDCKLLVGFSVGGSAVWQLCAENTFEQNLAAICFYSSQIRHMTALTPSIPTRLILPAMEAHYPVAELAAELAIKSNVTIETSEFFHGFMNKLSANFDSNACQYYIKRLTDLMLQQY